MTAARAGSALDPESGRVGSGGSPGTSRDALLLARADPVRLHMICVMTERPASARQLAESTGAPVDEVNHHLVVLERGGAVERVAVPGTEHSEPMYRALVRPIVEDDEWAALPVAVRRGIFSSLLRQAQEHADAAMRAGGFDRPDAHVSWTTMKVDEAAYARVVALLAETLDRAHAIQVEAVDRESRGDRPRDTLDTEIVLLHFVQGPRQRPPAAAMSAELRTPTLEDLYSLLEDMFDELPGDAPNWFGLAQKAREFAALAERRHAAASG